jgi:hypothetical protein
MRIPAARSEIARRRILTNPSEVGFDAEQVSGVLAPLAATARIVEALAVEIEVAEIEKQGEG